MTKGRADEQQAVNHGKPTAESAPRNSKMSAALAGWTMLLTMRGRAYKRQAGNNRRPAAEAAPRNFEMSVVSPAAARAVSLPPPPSMMTVSGAAAVRLPLPPPAAPVLAGPPRLVPVSGTAVAAGAGWTVLPMTRARADKLPAANSGRPAAEAVSGNSETSVAPLAASLPPPPSKTLAVRAVAVWLPLPPRAALAPPGLLPLPLVSEMAAVLEVGTTLPTTRGRADKRQAANKSRPAGEAAAKISKMSLALPAASPLPHPSTKPAPGSVLVQLPLPLPAVPALARLSLLSPVIETVVA